MVNTNKVLYYVACIVVSVVFLMVFSEQICRCDCSQVPKYGFKSSISGGEYFLSASQNKVSQKESIQNTTLCLDGKRIYRFPIEIITLLIFTILMVAFIIF